MRGKMKKKKVVRSLYQCLNAKVCGGEYISCSKGHSLFPSSSAGSVSIRWLALGKPLEMTVCNNCPDYDEMGPPVEEKDRGWRKIATR